MKELECESCGGVLIPEANGEYAKCAYCGTRVKLKEDINVNINFNGKTANDVNSEFADAAKSNMRKIGKAQKIILIVWFIFLIGMMITAITAGIISSNKSSKERTEREKQYAEEQAESEKKYAAEKAERERESAIHSYNFNIEHHSGAEKCIFVENMLDTINDMNQKNPERQLVVEYEGQLTSKADEIREIRKKIKQYDDEHKYEGIELDVIFTYDDEGYISKVTIQK